MRSDTTELLRSWQEGDRQALDELLRRHMEWMTDYVRQRIGHKVRRREETLDIVQDALIDLLGYDPRGRLSEKQQFRRLLARIVENNIRDCNKKLHRRCRDVDRERSHLSDRVLAMDPPVESVTPPTRSASDRERRQWIRLAVQLLRPTDRDVIALREWRGLTFAEIGDRLGITDDAARVRYGRALERLALKVAELRSGPSDAAFLVSA